MAVAMPCPDCNTVDEDVAGLEHPGIDPVPEPTGSGIDPTVKSAHIKGLTALDITNSIKYTESKTSVMNVQCKRDASSVPTTPCVVGKDAPVFGVGKGAECSVLTSIPGRDPTLVGSSVQTNRSMRPRALSSGSGAMHRNSGPIADIISVPFDAGPWTQKRVGSVPVFSAGPSETSVLNSGSKACVGSGMAGLTGNSSTRMNRLDNFKLRIRKGVADVGPRRGPVVARHPQVTTVELPTTDTAESTATSTSTATVIAETGNKLASPPTHSRAPPPPVLGDGSHCRKRSPSITRSRPSSPGNGSGRRPPSPGALDPALLEVIKRRVRRVHKVRLYLLQQPGPNSFLVGGDSPDHKYRVVIGPQSCSCGRGPHCLHVLFIMLRVFQVPEIDPRIYAKELKNYEVETLFQHYQRRRNSRVTGIPEHFNKDSSLSQSSSETNPSPSSEGSSRCVVESTLVSEDKHTEEEICPICLLEMVDGESLVVCSTGCRNKLHLHCMAIWAAECTQQGEYVLCPLCRQPWCDETLTLRTISIQNIQSTYYRHVPGSLPITKLPSPSAHSMHPMCFQPLPGPGPGPGPGLSRYQQKGTTWSQPAGALTKGLKKSQYLPVNKSEAIGLYSTSECKRPHGGAYTPFSDVPLPRSGPIPPEQMGIASEWIKVFGVDLVSCLYSRDWKDREIALRRLVNDVTNVYRSDNEERQQKVTWCCAKILAMVVADPVFKVYLGCVRCFRVLVNYATCRNSGQLEEFQDLIRPIIKTLIKKCADRNRRTSHLSAEVLVELAKGSNGELALGRHSADAIPWGFDGLELILSCILENFTVESVSWQWLSGRLLMLNTVLQIFPEEFCLRYVPLYAIESGYKLNNFNRVYSIIEFSFKALQSSHSTVSKLARHVFVVAASMAATERGMLNQILEMISELDTSLQSRLKKRLQAAIECQVQTSNGLQKKNKPTRSSQVANISQPINTNKVEMQGSSTISNSRSSSPPMRPKDLPLESLATKSKKGVKSQQSPSNHFSPVPTTKRWINSGSKLTSLFSRNKKTDELLPDKPELNGTCGINYGCRPAESPSTPTVDCGCQSPGDDDSLSFFSRVMGCVPNSPNDRPVIEKLVPFPLQVEEWPHENEEKSSDSGVVNEMLHVETLVRPGSTSAETENMGEIIKLTTYLEDVHWKRGPLLGTGAYSACYQARDIETGMLMAVKQVPYCRNSVEEQAGVEAGIRKEIVTMSKLSHPNVLNILGATRQGNHFNIFVEWMAGGSIAGILDNYGPFNQAVIIEYTKQILKGLNYLHENHILHRDLKGANLLVDSTGKQLRIGDFGAAARLESQSTVTGEFQGQLLGTIAFMAPEVLRGEDYGRSCDIWSVGCCMIEMATTKAPWKENRMSNHLALMYKIASSKDPPFIPDSLGPASKDLAVKCLQIRSDLRPTAKELLTHHCFKELSL